MLVKPRRQVSGPSKMPASGFYRFGSNTCSHGMQGDLHSHSGQHSGLQRPAAPYPNRHSWMPTHSQAAPCTPATPNRMSGEGGARGQQPRGRPHRRGRRWPRSTAPGPQQSYNRSWSAGRVHKLGLQPQARAAAQRGVLALERLDGRLQLGQARGRRGAVRRGRRRTLGAQAVHERLPG
jgi:hypothetical protein